MSAVTGRSRLLGQQTSAASSPVVIASDQSIVQTRFGDSASLDAFGRLRVASPTVALFASKLIYDNQPLVWDDQQVSGGGTTSTYNANQASVTLLADAGVAGRRVRQTFRRMNYQPGKSQLITITGALAPSGVGNSDVTHRIGYFDDRDGFYFQYDGASLGVAVRTFTSGVAVSTVVDQTDWNVDKMNGAGGAENPSGIAIDPAMAQIFVIDYQWLGVGCIRYGFDVGGVIYYCHQVFVANTQAIVSVSIPNLPVRYEVESSGTGVGTATTTCICATVVSEGGEDHVGVPLAVDTGTSVLTTANDSSIYALIAIQLQAGRSAASVVPDSFSVTSDTATAQFKILLLLNPTIAGAAIAYAPVANSSLQFGLGVAANTVTGGTKVFSQFAQLNRSGSFVGVPSQNDLALGTTIAGVSDTVVLAVQPVPAQGAVKFYGTLNYRDAA